MSSNAVIRNQPSPSRLPPTSWYARQCLYLLLSALFFFWLSRDGRLDAWLTAPWFDMMSQHFPLQENRWVELLNHRLSKIIVIASSVLALAVGLKTGNRRLLWVVVLMACGALVVSVLKANSTHSCPWDLIAYGGTAQPYLLLDSPSMEAGPGHCFPGGHASTGFVLMAWFFWFYPEHPRRAWICWGLAALAGLLLGYGQIMRGAHFLSHNLWSGWWVWATQLLVNGLLIHGKSVGFVDRFLSSVLRLKSSGIGNQKSANQVFSEPSPNQ